MSKIISIKKRSDSIGKIKKISKAMEIIALTRLKKSQKNTIDSRFYFDKIRNLVFDVARKININAHPFFVKKEIKTIGIIVISSDKGLCGGFNNNVIEKVRRICEEKKDFKISLITLGKKGYNYFINKNYEIFGYLFDLSKIDIQERADLLGESLIKAFTENKIDELYLVFNYFKLQLLGEAKIFKVLPITYEKREGNIRDYIYEPGAEEIFDKLLKEYLKCQITHAIKESKTAEEMARMMAMKQAGDSAEDLINNLLLKYHKERQKVITRELIDVVNASKV